MVLFAPEKSVLLKKNFRALSRHIAWSFDERYAIRRVWLGDKLVRKVHSPVPGEKVGSLEQWTELYVHTRRTFMVKRARMLRGRGCRRPVTVGLRQRLNQEGCLSSEIFKGGLVERPQRLHHQLAESTWKLPRRYQRPLVATFFNHSPGRGEPGRRCCSNSLEAKVTRSYR